jgi:hypothetical protein
MADISKVRLIDKAKRHDKQERIRKPALAPLVAGAGTVMANGRLSVALPRTDGTTTVYSAVPVATWRFYPEAPVTRLRARPSGDGAEAVATPSPAARIRAAIDMALTELADIERRAHAAAHLEPESQTRIAAE